jgi:hypothetical protein
MSVITGLLDNLYAERQALKDAQERAQSYIPAEIKDWIAASEQRIACLEQEIKSKAEYIPDSRSHTLEGTYLQLVWVEGGEVTYTRKSAWSIRARGRK